MRESERGHHPKKELRTFIKINARKLKLCYLPIGQYPNVQKKPIWIFLLNECLFWSKRNKQHGYNGFCIWYKPLENIWSNNLTKRETHFCTSFAIHKLMWINNRTTMCDIFILMMFDWKTMFFFCLWMGNIFNNDVNPLHTSRLIVITICIIILLVNFFLFLFFLVRLIHWS